MPCFLLEKKNCKNCQRKIRSQRLVVLFVVIIFPFSNVAGIVESIRNILLLTLVMGSAGIRRGFSEKGLEKDCYTVAWSDLQKGYVN